MKAFAILALLAAMAFAGCGRTEVVTSDDPFARNNYGRTIQGDARRSHARDTRLDNVNKIKIGGSVSVDAGTAN